MHPRKCRRGAAAVEFALCFPVVLLIFLASFEFCRANMIRHTADNAAYEGARRAIVPGATAADAENAARKMMAVVGAKEATFDVDPPVIDDDTPEVTVTVTVPLDANGFVAPMFLKGKTVTSGFTLARERYAQTSVP